MRSVRQSDTSGMDQLAREGSQGPGPDPGRFVGDRHLGTKVTRRKPPGSRRVIKDAGVSSA
jgi:hypothetical protein